jgi:hypothetical protein
VAAAGIAVLVPGGRDCDRGRCQRQGEYASDCGGECGGKKSSTKNRNRRWHGFGQSFRTYGYWTDRVDLDGNGAEEETHFLFGKKR